MGTATDIPSETIHFSDIPVPSQEHIAPDNAANTEKEEDDPSIELLHLLNGHIRKGIGIDLIIKNSIALEHYTLCPGAFPHDFYSDQRFDVITMLAVVEHIPENQLQHVAETCYKYLMPKGRIIITAPHPRVDKILNILKTLGVIKGLSLEEHYGFNPEQLPDIFNKWKLIKEERWELGLNYLFVFEKY